MAVETISRGDITYAIIIRRDLPVSNEVKFLTNAESPLQLGVIQRNTGYKFRPHIHRDMHYNVNTTQEFLLVQEGRLRATIYSHEWDVVAEVELGPGDSLLSMTGGHSFEVLEAVRLVEVKQGPYPGDKYAKLFKEE